MENQGKHKGTHAIIDRNFTFGNQYDFGHNYRGQEGPAITDQRKSLRSTAKAKLKKNKNPSY